MTLGLPPTCGELTPSLKVRRRAVLERYRDVVEALYREGEQGRFNFKCDRGATYGMTQLLYSDAIVGFLTEFAATTEHRPEILLSFGFVPARYSSRFERPS